MKNHLTAIYVLGFALLPLESIAQEVTVDDILVYESTDSGRRGEIRLQRTADGKEIYIKLPTGNLHLDPKTFAATVRREDSKDGLYVDVVDGKNDRVAGSTWTNKYDSTPRQGAQCQSPVVKNQIKVTISEPRVIIIQDGGKERSATTVPSKQEGGWMFCIQGKTTGEVAYSDELKVLTSMQYLVTDSSGSTVYSKFGIVLKEIIRKK